MALYALLTLAILYTLFFAASLLIPLVIAIMLSLLLSPMVTFLQRFYIPRAVSSVLLLIAIGGPFTLLGAQLVEPAQKWLERVPELTTEVNEQLNTISEALAPAEPETGAVAPAPNPIPQPPKEAGFNWFGWFGDDEPVVAPAQAPPVPAPPTPEAGSALSEQVMLGGLDITLRVIAETPGFLARCLVCFLLIVFLLVYGPGIYDTAIDVFPGIRNKAKTTELVAATQRELSRYILTVSVINTGLGLATALALWLLRFEDPLLWGAIVALLNFAPYLGMLLSLAILSLAGMAEFGMAWEALLPAGAFFILNAIEAQLVTPMVLGRNMQMNPVVIVIWLMVWGWLWGVAGVLIAVPLLVCTKLVLARTGVLQPWLKLIESRT